MIAQDPGAAGANNTAREMGTSGNNDASSSGGALGGGHEQKRASGQPLPPIASAPEDAAATAAAAAVAAAGRHTRPFAAQLPLPAVAARVHTSSIQLHVRMCLEDHKFS